MSSNSHIRTLLNPPSLQASHTKAKEEINLRFLTIDNLEDLDSLVPEFRARQDGLKKKVRSCTQQHFLFHSKYWKLRYPLLKRVWMTL